LSLTACTPHSWFPSLAHTAAAAHPPPVVGGVSGCCTCSCGGILATVCPSLVLVPDSLTENKQKKVNPVAKPN